MSIPGHVAKGVVVLEGGATLPEGAQVVVSLRTEPNIRVAATQRPVQLPIFDFDGPPDIELTNDRIAELLTREDAFLQVYHGALPNPAVDKRKK